MDAFLSRNNENRVQKNACLFRGMLRSYYGQKDLEGWAGQAIVRMEVYWDHPTGKAKTCGYYKSTTHGLKSLAPSQKETARRGGTESTTALLRKRCCSTISRYTGHPPWRGYWMILLDIFKLMGMAYKLRLVNAKMWCIWLAGRIPDENLNAQWTMTASGLWWHWAGFEI